MLAAPFASLSNTLCAPNNPKARTVTFGFSAADIDAENTTDARSPAVRSLMSLLKIMSHSPRVPAGVVAGLVPAISIYSCFVP